MDGRAFAGCPTLTDVEFKGTIAEWENVENKEVCMLQCIPATSVKCADGVWDKPSVEFRGTKAQWEAVVKKDTTFSQTQVKSVKCSDGEVSVG